MNIYLLRRTGPGNYDEAWGFVVKAHIETEARMYAQAKAGDEGSSRVRGILLKDRSEEEFDAEELEQLKFVGETFWTNEKNPFVTCTCIASTRGYAWAKEPIPFGVILRDFHHG